jgi:demethylmenaquinone methyltransferase/2-methoxy-6-polyprenyl-1,4-benzoquinol methylase
MMHKENNNSDEKNFGFKKVTSIKKRTLVDKVFYDVAKKYDLMNDVMSFGIHRLWKDEFCRMIPDLNSNILDVAGGTGDIAFRIKNRGKKQNKDPHVIVCDINKEMLKLCMDKAIDNNILTNFDIVLADAEKLPFLDNSFDYYTIAFGIRNVISLENTLAEAYRVLKPTGKFICLEFSKVKNDFVRQLYDFYSFNLIPSIGQVITNNKSAYKYLAESISLFPSQEDFRELIQKAGFIDTGYKSLTHGVVAIHYGYKI